MSMPRVLPVGADAEVYGALLWSASRSGSSVTATAPPPCHSGTQMLCHISLITYHHSRVIYYCCWNSFTCSEHLNALNPELNPICYLLALLGAHHFLHVGRIRVKLLTFRRLMSYIYGAPILDVSRSHTTTQHSR